MVEIVGYDSSHPGQSSPLRSSRRTKMECPWCGPWFRGPSDTVGVCPRCKMTAGEHAYRAEILADSAALFAREWREFQEKRRASR